MTGRYHCAGRVVRLLRYLESCRYPQPLRTLAERFGVSTRTIRRDVSALEQAGAHVPIGRDRGSLQSSAMVGPLRWR